MALRPTITLAAVMFASAMFRVAWSLALPPLVRSADQTDSATGEAELKKQAEELLESMSKCIPKLDGLKTLGGTWQMAYYKEPVDVSVDVALAYHDDTKIPGGVLDGQMTENGKEPVYRLALLCPNVTAFPGHLVNALTIKGFGFFPLHVFELAAKANKYFAVFQIGFGPESTMDWAVYVKPGVQLSDGELAEVTGALDCLKPLTGVDMPLHKLQQANAGGGESPSKAED